MTAVAAVKQARTSAGGNFLDHQLFARIGLSLLCALQGIATVAIDFNRTHATNPAWPGHARFHVVWQSNAVFLGSCVQLLLLWVPALAAREGFYLAALLAAMSPLGFLSALAGRRLYGGTLSDPNGIPPARIRLSGRVTLVDLNLVAVLAAVISLPVLLAVYRA